MHVRRLATVAVAIAPLRHQLLTCVIATLICMYDDHYLEYQVMIITEIHCIHALARQSAGALEALPLQGC